MKLTDKAIRNAKPTDKTYKLFDGGGLFLEIMPNGSKLWRLKYRFLGKEKRISFGPYPLVTLAAARDDRDDAKRLLLKDIDPSTNKQEKRRDIILNLANTLEAVARKWHDNQKGRWDEKHAANVLRRMEMDIFPYMGKRPIADINAPELLLTLKKIEARGALDIAGRVKSICSQVFVFGIQTGHCTRNPAADLKGALKTRKTKHFAAIETKEIPGLIHALERNKQRLYFSTIQLILFSLHTFVRPGEARSAKWSEIDFEKAQWTIPAERMKMRRDHLVPLSKQVLQILQEQKEQNARLNTPWVFASPIRPMESMSDGAVLVALKRMGYKGKMTAHGFRALARTAIREELEYEPDVIEQQLAHKAPGALGEAYDRARFIKKRQQMMQDWSNYLERVAAKGKVIKAHFGNKQSAAVNIQVVEEV